MVWHFIGIYIINRVDSTLHDRFEIRNFSSRVEKYFTRLLRSLVLWKKYSAVQTPATGRSNKSSPVRNVVCLISVREKTNGDAYPFNSYQKSRGDFVVDLFLSSFTIQ